MNRWHAALAALCHEAGAANEADAHSGIARIERMFGITLPESHAEFMQRVSSLRQRVLGDFDVLTLEQALAVLQQVDSGPEGRGEDSAEEVDVDLASFADERIRCVVWSGKRVPFASFNGDVWLCLDFSPSASGIPGQVILLDPEALGWRWIAPDFETLLVEVAAGRKLDEELL